MNEDEKNKLVKESINDAKWGIQLSELKDKTDDELTRETDRLYDKLTDENKKITSTLVEIERELTLRHG